MGITRIKGSTKILADVEELTDAAQDIDGKKALVVGAVLFGRVDADTILPVAIDASGNLKIIIG